MKRVFYWDHEVTDLVLQPYSNWRSLTRRGIIPEGDWLAGVFYHKEIDSPEYLTRRSLTCRGVITKGEWLVRVLQYTRGRLTRKGNIPWRGRLSHWCIIHPATLTPEGIDLTWWYYTLERYRKVRINRKNGTKNYKMSTHWSVTQRGSIDEKTGFWKSHWTVLLKYEFIMVFYLIFFSFNINKYGLYL